MAYTFLIVTIRFKIKIVGNVTFKFEVTIENLHVKGNSNGIHPTDYLKNIVGINDDVSISGTTTFKRKVDG